jgi:predicted nucleic acid-binding Zn ribbon protein
MPLQPLNQVLHTLRTHPMWQEQRQFQWLLESWPEIVGPVVGAQTRPLRICRQRVLRVATSSAVWAQNLAFERHLILTKLNARLQPPLIDIQFSTQQWQQRPQASVSPQASLLSWSSGSRQAPSRINPQPQDVQAAFRRWSAAVQGRSQGLPRCPRCQCPTPPEELQRWQICSLCAARTLSTKKPSLKD